LVLENKDGLRFQSPQNMLDSLLGRLTFDPLEFMRQDPKKQFATLRQLTGVNTDRLDAIRQKAYDERTQVNAMVKRLEVQAEAISVPAGTPTTEVSSDEIVKQIQSAIHAGNELEKVKKAIIQDKLKLKQADERQVLLRRQIAEMMAEIEGINASATLVHDELVNLEKTEAEMIIPDVSHLQWQLGEAQQTNKAVAQYQKREELRREAVTTKKLADDLTAKIDTVDAEKNKMIAEAKFPLEGLGFGAGVVTYKELPLEQASSAEQLRVSMAMAMALNPKIRVIRITDGSLLDSSSMAEVEAMAKDNDFQVWAELVDESGKVGIVIEDGRVIADNQTQSEAP
jgi:hypothetical protein